MRPGKSISVFWVVLLLAGSVRATDVSLDSVRLLAADGRTEEALASLAELVASQPDDPEILFLRGVLLAELGRVDEAENTFAELVRLHPELPEPYNNLAVIQAAAGRYEEAVETLKGALQTHSSYRTAWENLTRIYGRLASEAYNKALDVSTSAEEGKVELILLSSISERASGPLTDSPALVDTASTLTASKPLASPVAPLGGEAVVVDTPSTSETSDKPKETEQAAAVESKPGAEGTDLAEGSAGGIEAPAGEIPSEETPQERVAKEPMVAEEIVEEEAPPSPGDLAAVVEAWARSWSDQRVEEYLSFYSEVFEPAGGMSRGLWERQRRERLTAPDFVKVSVAFLDFEIGDESAEITFNQSYESNTFADLVTKTLELTREEGGWKILREVVVP